VTHDSYRILLLTSDPSDAARLRIGEELREIRSSIQTSRLLSIELFERHAVRARDVTEAVLAIRPNVVHFSGHGRETGELCLEDEVGQVHPVAPSALEALFRLLKDQVLCVVFNSCYSRAQAERVATSIKYVVGMNSAMGDKAAIQFSAGFYKALAADQSIEQAFQFGLVELRLLNHRAYRTPVLIRNPTLNPRHVSVQAKKIEDSPASRVVWKDAPSLPGYVSIQLEGLSYVLIDPNAYQTLGELLDELYVEYLSEKFPLLSYGQNWVLEESVTQTIAAPLEWALRAPLPFTDLSRERWAYTRTLADERITESSAWRVRSISKEDLFFGMALQSDYLASSVLGNPKTRRVAQA
jgi:hypothetical protein